MRFVARVVVAALMLGPAAHASLAQPFPSRQITIVVPFAPGASADGTARTLANELTGRLGTSVVVENKAGGGGVIGLQAMARSEPDGYTLAIGAPGAVTVGPNLPGAPPFDPTKEMSPIAKLVDVPNVIVTRSDTGPKSLKELIERAKASPNGMSYGSTGARSSQHLAVEFLKHLTGANLIHVSYRGSAPATNDALGGQIAFASVDLTAAHPLVKAGQLRALALQMANRVSFAPDIPTLSEAGFPGFTAAPWLGLFAPAGTPEATLKILGNHAGAIIAKPEVGNLIRNLSLEPSFLGPAEFKAFLVKDDAFWKAALARIGPLN